RRSGRAPASAPDSSRSERSRDNGSCCFPSWTGGSIARPRHAGHAPADRARLRRINPPESGLKAGGAICVGKRPARCGHRISAAGDPFMSQLPAELFRQPWFKKARTAALGFGLGASLAVSPLVWAQNPPADTSAASQNLAVPQQSFAPLVKKVL